MPTCQGRHFALGGSFKTINKNLNFRMMQILGELTLTTLLESIFKDFLIIN